MVGTVGVIVFDILTVCWMTHGWPLRTFGGLLDGLSPTLCQARLWHRATLTDLFPVCYPDRSI